MTGFGTTNYITTMQDMTVAVCHGAREGETGQLIDSRDGNIYTVAKLQDDCWMTQNLAIINQTINSTNSDMTSGSFAIPTADISGFTGDDQNNPKAYYDAEYGGYYNWYTATAGTGNTSITNSNAPSSICPKGWQLPAYGTALTDKSYSKLLSELNIDDITIAPYNFAYSGNVLNNSLINTNKHGNYWSSKAVSANNAYNLNFNSGGINPSASSARSSGFSVRCVAR